MRGVLSSLIGAGLIMAATAACRGDDAAEMKALVEKGIKAAGGAEAIAEHKAATWSDKGTYHGAGAEQPYTGKYASEGPDKFKMEILDVFAVVLDGDKGWMKAGGETREMTAEEVAETKEQTHVGHVMSLVPLKDPKFKLSPAGKSKVDGKEAIGVNVAHEGRRDVTLYFDPDTSLVVKYETSVKSQEQGGKIVSEEAVFSDYRDVKGMKIPHKMSVKRDGELYVVSETTEYEPARSLDADTFGKP
jgi:outer membrane lipoprotein-sorting protein